MTSMVALFDTAEMDRWTPLPHPFNPAAAAAYLERARIGRADGTVQLAITDAGGEALGEVLLFPTELPGICELAYAVGAEHRGRGLAVRSVLALLALAAAAGYGRARLRVAVDNAPSRRVAEAAGFVPTSEPLVRRERKGHVLELATWVRELAAQASPAD